MREGKETEGAKFSDYFDFDEPFSKMPSHRILAMFRGEKEDVLTLTIEPLPAGTEVDGPTEYESTIARKVGVENQGRAADKWLVETVRWAWRTKILVHLGIDLRMRLRQIAEDEAIRVFAANLRDLLLAAPAGTRATMGLDPGFRTGVKVAVVDATGKVVNTGVIYPHVPQNQWDKSIATLAALAAAHNVELIAIGNGTASRETDKLAAELIAKHPELKLTKAVVSEAGASVYSASAFASQELPGMDVSLRGAVSIARRLQDPLAELVKIDPKSIGVGQYQHDLPENSLSRSLDAVVEDCVNAVGVDLNTASAPLLTRVSGITPGLADNIVLHRDQNGPFTSRTALKEVARLGPKAFEQAAGFLRIPDGDDPLDASSVHPEAYPVVRRMLDATGQDVKALIGSADLKKLKAADFVDDMFGLPTVTDILAELDKPGRDPRPAFKTAVFAEGVDKIGDLKPGMRLEGQVTNVAAFGAFIDIGVHQDGLAHVSALSKNFVKDPREVVKPGDIVKVKVLEVDIPRKRISLTLRLDDELGSSGGRPGDRGPGAGGNQGGRGPGKAVKAVRAAGGQGGQAAVKAAVRAVGLAAVVRAGRAVAVRGWLRRPRSGRARVVATAAGVRRPRRFADRDPDGRDLPRRRLPQSRLHRPLTPTGDGRLRGRPAHLPAYGLELIAELVAGRFDRSADRGRLQGLSTDYSYQFRREIDCHRLDSGQHLEFLGHEPDAVTTTHPEHAEPCELITPPHPASPASYGAAARPETTRRTGRPRSRSSALDAARHGW